MTEDTHPEQQETRTRPKRVRRAIRAGLGAWPARNGAGASPEQPPDPAEAKQKKRKKKEKKKAKKRELRDRVQSSIGGEPLGPDERLANLDDILNSPLGQAWVTDPFGNAGTRTFEPNLTGATGIVAPLPRRRMLETSNKGNSIPAMSRTITFEASAIFTLGRLFVWMWAAIKFRGGVFIDVLRGVNTPRTEGRRLRFTFESLGPTFVKLGQQLAIRADILPYEYCEELQEMLDRVAPMPSEQAIQTIERSTGKPIGESFMIFDPESIGSGSLACVYQAVLHDGQLVAVKVRRPKILKRLAGDVRALGWLIQIAETFSFVREGMTRNIRYELYNMLREEVDFVREARYTDLFRTQAEEYNQNYVTAPRVYHEFTSENLLVTEYVSGVFLSEVLSAMDRTDAVALGQLQARGIDPKVVAQNLVMAFNWETLENLLFHGDPHPANIIVRPDNRLVFIDFGSCGRFSSRQKRLWGQFHYHLSREDVYGMTEVAISMLEPLPPMDLDAFTKEIEALYWDWLYAMKVSSAEWWEKASGVMWMKFIAVSRRYRVPINLDTLKVLRVTFLFDTIIFRLWNDLDLRGEYQRYHRNAGRRARKRVQKAVRQRLEKGARGRDYLKLEDMMRMGDQITGRLQHILDTPRHNFGIAIDKAAYAISITLQALGYGLGLHLFIVLFLSGYNVMSSSKISLWDSFVAVVTHPLYQVVPFAIILVLIRKILARVRDVDVPR